MELKEGYKQTDVGVIPEDWELQELPKLYSIERNASYSRADTVNNGPVKYLHYGDIHTGLSGLIHRNEIPEEISKDNGKGYHLLCSGDVVLADASEDIEGVGAAVEIFNPNNEACIAGLHTIVLSPRDRSVAPGFGALFSKMPIVGSQFRFYAAGLKVFGLSKSNIKKVILPLPPLREQQAIAEVLSDVDAEIESLARRLDKLVNQKQGLSEELLSGRTRLVEPKSKGFKQTDVGLIPEDWEWRRLGEISFVRKGDLIRRSDGEDGNIPVISAGKSPSFYHSKPNRIGPVVTISASGANAGYVGLHEGEIFAGDCSSIETDSNTTTRYLGFYLQHLQQDIYALQEGGAQPHVQPPDIIRIPVVIPPVWEQELIVKVQKDVDAEIQAVAKLKAKVQAKKEGLMQTLLTGKIRLT